MENSFNAPKEEIQRIYREEFAHNILSNGTPIKENVDYLRERIKEDEYTFVCITLLSFQVPKTVFHNNQVRMSYRIEGALSSGD